jgi:hypothetical protein
MIGRLSAELMRRIRHFGDFFTIPLAIATFVDLAGIDRLHLILVGTAVWTLMEYLVHRSVFHQYSISFIMTIRAILTPKDPASARRSLHPRLDFC